MHNQPIPFADATTVSPYSPLRQGLWRIDDWGGFALVLQGHSEACCIVVVFDDDGMHEATTLWSNDEATEQLADAVRYARDDEQDEHVLRA